MSQNQDMILRWLKTNMLASSFTLTEISGDACPCMISRDSARPSYSKEWHRNNPSETNCNNLGIINTSTANTACKGVLLPPGLAGNSIPGGKEFLEAIGEIQTGDLICWGTVNTLTMAFVDLSGKSEYTTYVTYDSNKYTIRDVSDICGIGQVALFRRRKN